MYNISTDIEQIKKNLTNMYVSFNNLNNQEAVTKRESDNILEVKNQINSDRLFINSLRNNALEIFDLCNQFLMKTNINEIQS